MYQMCEKESVYIYVGQCATHDESLEVVLHFDCMFSRLKKHLYYAPYLVTYALAFG